ncbi:serine/threonine protein kinase, partial [candidate division KSB1 bacterium]|nr:serine/threonine protein kinase [candidate division KSB1 bacterium]
MADLVGKTISHYRITEQVGQGGMGVVYKARDVKLNRTVALKFLPADLTRDAEAVQRFMNEAHAASSLDHPNICTIHEIDETEDGKMFIVMTFYEGETLKDKIEGSPLSVEEAVDISIQIASGLAKAHSQKIVHRDIKPANIILTNDGTAKILDFGLAKMADIKLTKAGTTLGTLAYMSPEQLHGDEVDERTDVWSLAVVLYEMLSGRLPFKGENEQAIFFNIINEEPKPIDIVRADVPKEIESVLDQAMEKAVDV